MTGKVVRCQVVEYYIYFFITEDMWIFGFIFSERVSLLYWQKNEIALLEHVTEMLIHSVSVC